MSTYIFQSVCIVIGTILWLTNQGSTVNIWMTKTRSKNKTPQKAKRARNYQLECRVCRVYSRRCGSLHPPAPLHDDVIKWKHYSCYWPFVRGIRRSPVNSPDKGQWRGALLFSLICAWINAWANNREAGDLRRHRAHYDVIVSNWAW